MNMEIKITDNEGNQFEYDSLSRKTSMNDPDRGLWRYYYDENGNLVKQTGGGGNLVSGDGYYREYDRSGQLIRVRNGSTSTSPVLENYTYDHTGQRVKIWRNDSANTTVYTPFPEMMRIVNSSGTYDYYYVYHEGQLVARKNPDNTTTQIHTDHLGSSTVSTNATQGIIEQTTYDPYGLELSGGNYDVKGYTGQFDDEATSQMYYGARYYVPSRGMFVQPDPVMQNVYDPQFLNHYASVRNNPYKLVDPDGKEVVVAIRHTDISVVGDTGHIAFVVRNPDAKISSQSYSYYSNNGPNTENTGLKHDLGGTFLAYKSSYSSASGSSSGEALPDSYYSSFVIQTTPGQERQIIAQAEEIKADPRRYGALYPNSQDYVIESLKAGEIDLERKFFPKNTFNVNKDTYASQNQEFFLTPFEKINRGIPGNGGGGRRNSGQADALARFWAKKRSENGGGR